MQPATVGAILDAIGKHWTVAPDVEVTLEANPTSVEADALLAAIARPASTASRSACSRSTMPRSRRSAGCTPRRRRSTPSPSRARRSTATSFDLIYARPRQTPQMWADELKHAIAEAAEHLSLYQLTIEPETPFHTLHAAGKLVIPDDDTARALYDMTQEICERAGLPAYEISNHARPGAECRHNLVYWRAHEYAGIGPGAHGRLDIDGYRHATMTEKRPEAWLMRVESLGHGIVTDDLLSREERADEFLLMGLRLAEGIDPARYTALAGRPLDPERIGTLAAHGFVESDGARLPARDPAGFPVLDAVVADLAA